MEAQVGERAVARDEFSGDAGRYEGTVWTHGEFWRARSRTPVALGSELEVRGRDGMTLLVEQPGDRSGSDPDAAGQRVTHSP